MVCLFFNSRHYNILHDAITTLYHKYSTFHKAEHTLTSCILSILLFKRHRIMLNEYRKRKTHLHLTTWKPIHFWSRSTILSNTLCVFNMCNEYRIPFACEELEERKIIVVKLVARMSLRINFIFTARIRRMGKGNVFTGVCPFTGEGVPHPWSGVPQSWPCTGTPSKVRMGYLPARSGWGTCPAMSGWGTPLVRSMGYPLFRSGWGAPLVRSGWGTLWSGQDGVPCGQVRMG